MLRDDVKYYSLSPSILTKLLDIGGVPEAPLKLENFHQNCIPGAPLKLETTPVPPKLLLIPGAPLKLVPPSLPILQLIPGAHP
jgi:hypothetical protein